ncbi:hypothetical protein KIN34_13385 [Cellulomonas sp. DKR-3]|uniref:Fungal lipase-like domain-containing protein n=1 Tax=Cellulomonas fulva TaxID=2835530 RepID=A0ABS5U1Q0_9CELL|nr:hypothetical protein [Cellulomonas fulva]MBT0995277.1 hypothetical protein [Cellulomonas fulva]
MRAIRGRRGGPACRTHDDERAGETLGPDVLELRVHGVANTPPAQMLDLLPGEVEQVDGDDLGSFWAPTPAAAAAARPPGDCRSAPAGVRREAYSWGAMARFSTVPGLGRVSGTIAGLVRALWVLIIPFGLVNVAYWARDADEPAGRRSSAAGGLVRLFGLTLTLLWVASVATVLLGVVGTQCYGPREQVPLPGGGTVDYVLTCSALPGWADAAARWGVGGRTAALAAVVAVAVLVLAAVGSTGRLRYERRMSAAKARGLADAAARGTDVWPALARPGFWTHARRSAAQWCQHLAAAYALLAGLLAWHFLYRDVPACARATGFADRGCLDPGTWGSGKGGWALLVGASTVLLLLAAWRVARLRVDPLPHGAPGVLPDAHATRGPDVALLVGSLVVLVCALVAVARSGDRPLGAVGPEPFLGLVALPRILVAVMVLLAVVAVGVRARVAARLWAPLVVTTLAAALVAVVWADAAVAARAVAGAALAALVVLVAVASRTRDGRRREGWGGRGPAVLLCLAGGTAMVLSAAAVLGAVAWLEAPGAAENVRTPAAVTDVLDEASAADPLRDAVTVHVPQAAELATPAGYLQFAVASVAVLLLLGAAVLVLLARMAATRRRTPPVLPGDPPPPAPRDAQEAAVQRGRRHAAVAHRAEPVVGLLAALSFGALVAALVLPDPRQTFGGPAGEVWRIGVQWADRAVVTVLGLVVVSVVLAGSKRSLARPWGLLWDLMCFLPRAAHPFAPPCYAERVVPELRARVDAWLGDYGTPLPGGPAQRERRRVVLSAHSLGGAVAVAALLARWDGTTGPHDHRVALLTYGTQLRSYFGRFFPELLGPVALGTRPIRGPRLWAVDPWDRAVPAAPDRLGTTLVESLTGPADGAAGDRTTTSTTASTTASTTTSTRWRSLWRRTDFIGFPVDGYRGGVIDTPATEVDPEAYLLTVASHSGYPRTPQYAEELGALVATLRAARPG